MRRAILWIVLALVGAGCNGSGGPAVAPEDEAQISFRPTVAPYARVSAGPVTAIVPDGWKAVPAGPTGGPRGGFVASPHPNRWLEDRGDVSGMAATWVDATQIGVPSDYYYLAARGPLFSRLLAPEGCRTIASRVFVDNVPSFTSSAPSTGDYVARGSGVCALAGRAVTRWAYFVAAPGFGPARQIGIPNSGLYVVVATAPDSPKAEALLERLLEHTRFNGASIGKFVAATRRSASGLIAA